MLRTDSENLKGDSDAIRRLGAELQVSSRVKAARIMSRTTGRLRRLLRLDATRTGHPVTLRLVSCDRQAGGDHDTPAAVIAEREAFEARVGIGSLVVLEDDIEIARRTNGVPPAGQVVRTRGGGNEILLICHWWTRRNGRFGKIDHVARIDRSELVPHVYALRAGSGKTEAPHGPRDD